MSMKNEVSILQGMAVHESFDTPCVSFLVGLKQICHLPSVRVTEFHESEGIRGYLIPLGARNPNESYNPCSWKQSDL